MFFAAMVEGGGYSECGLLISTSPFRGVWLVLCARKCTGRCGHLGVAWRSDGMVVHISRSDLGARVRGDSGSVNIKQEYMEIDRLASTEADNGYVPERDSKRFEEYFVEVHIRADTLISNARSPQY